MAGAGSDNDSAADAERAAHLVKEGEEEAIAWSMQEIDRRYAGLATTFGTKARRYTRQDLRCHLECLASSLATCEPAYFVAYVRWQTGILKARGIPIGTLNESLPLLMQFFDGRLDQAARAKVAQIMQGGLAAVIADLRDDDPLASALRPLREVEALTLSLIRGDVATVRSIAAQAGGGRRYLRVATRLFQPSLYAVGHLWACWFSCYFRYSRYRTRSASLRSIWRRRSPKPRWHSCCSKPSMPNRSSARPCSPALKATATRSD